MSVYIAKKIEGESAAGIERAFVVRAVGLRRGREARDGDAEGGSDLVRPHAGVVRRVSGRGVARVEVVVEVPEVDSSHAGRLDDVDHLLVAPDPRVGRRARSRVVRSAPALRADEDLARRPRVGADRLEAADPLRDRAQGGLLLVVDSESRTTREVRDLVRSLRCEKLGY